MTLLVPTEHQIQCAFVDYTRIRALQDEIWAMWFAVPNGGFRFRTTAGRLKAEGAKSGVPDTFWPVMRGQFGGLWIEFKAHAGRLSDAQEWWVKRLRNHGYRVEVCRSADEAIDVSEGYARG